MAYDPALVVQDEAEFTTAPKFRALLYVATEDGQFLPVTPEMLAGNGSTSGGGAAAGTPEPVECFPPEFLEVGNEQKVLTVPQGANAATVYVTTGNLRRCLGGPATQQTRMISTGTEEKLRGAELAAYRMKADDGMDVPVELFIEYSRIEVLE